jgi:hypothetical protein
MLSKAKHLVFSSGYEVEILRLPPQNDIATQSRRGEDIGGPIVEIKLTTSDCRQSYARSRNRLGLIPAPIAFLYRLERL